MENFFRLTLIIIVSGLLLFGCSTDGGDDSTQSPQPTLASWGTAEVIETSDSVKTGGPQIAVDNDGNAIVVWVQKDGTNNTWANRYDGTTESWGTAELIENDDTGDAHSPQIAFDGNGNAIAVWRQDGTCTNIWANRYDGATESWGTPGVGENNESNR